MLCYVIKFYQNEGTLFCLITYIIALKCVIMVYYNYKVHESSKIKGLY